MTQSFWLPTIRGQFEINRKAPASTIEILQTVVPYELGLAVNQLNYSCLYPVYIRGQAYLAAGQGAAAATEFQKILDHRGLVQNCPTGAMAISASPALSLYRKTHPKPAPPIRTSSHCGKIQTPIYLSSIKRRRSPPG